MIEYQAQLAKGRSFRKIAADWEREHFEEPAPNTLRSYRAPLRRAVDHFGDTPIKQISPPEIKSFVCDFAAQHHAKKTVATQLQIVNMICS